MFRNKLFVIITAVMLFMAPRLYAAPEDKIFTSSGQILPGEEWDNVYIYNDDTVVDMLGGDVDGMGTYDTSTVNVTGGYVSTLGAHESSTANVSGGYVYGIFTWEHAYTNFFGDARARSLGAGGDFSTIRMAGGITEYLRVGGSGTINLYGGQVSEYLNAWDSAIVNIYGYGFKYDPNGGSKNGGQLTGFWLDNTAFTIDLYNRETYTYINLIIGINVKIDVDPKTFNLQSKGKWISCRILLPEGYNVSDINPDTILLERRFKAEWKWYNEKQNVVMAKFRRSQLASFLEPGEIELIVSCHLIDGTYFEGTDTVKVTDKSRGRR